MTANATVKKGIALAAVGRVEDAIAAYDEDSKRFAEATEPAIQQSVAEALFSMGGRLGAVDRQGDALAVDNEGVRRLASGTRLMLREAVGRRRLHERTPRRVRPPQ